MNLKSISPLKLEAYLFGVVYAITFVRCGWLMAEGADPRPVLFLMGCCAVWFGLIAFLTRYAEKNMAKIKARDELRRKHHMDVRNPQKRS
jgi:hypothetical protein